MEKLNQLNQYRTQPGNMWYDPFSAATNNAVNELKSYGINPADLTPDWFNANTSWQGYLSYNGTTTTPSKPGKKASEQEKAAYALYQYQKSMDVTNAAKNEWTAAQEEINYWANRKDLNLSDDEIIRRVFGSGKKYTTLKKMDDSRSTGSPLELNEAIDYNQDSVRGAIWAARNGGGTGNIRQDIANYYLKSGNSWKDDPNISAKLNIDNLDTFSRYEVGMAGDGMDKAGVYFGVPSFSKADVEALRNNVDWEDETSVKMYQTVLAAEETTEKAEAELANLTKAFQRRLNRGFKDQNEANKWIDSQLESSDYSTLAKMDASLKSGKIMDMTRAVPYRKQMLQQMAADSIANPKKTGSEILSSYGMPVNDADDSVTRVENEKVGSSIDALGTFLSQGEKDYFDAVPGVDYAKITAGYNGIAEGMKSGMINITNHATKYAEEANGKYNKTWLGSLANRNQYERYQATADRLAAEVEDFEKNNGTKILASESIESEPIFSLDDGTQVQLIYDEETGEYEVGNVWNDMWRFGQTSPEHLAAANEKAEQLRIEQNNRANGIRTAKADAGEMDADTIKGVEEYNKKKEQLAALNGYLDENKAGYEQSLRDAEIAKANRDALGGIAAKALGVEYDPSTADSIMQFAGGWYDYESPPADGITLIEESTGKTTEDINKEIADNNANVQDLQFVLSMLGDNAPEDLKQKINQAISDAERQNRVYGDYMITKNPRFDYLARKGQESLHFTEMDEPVEGMNKNWFFMMSDEEKKIYYALVNTDGVESADRFYTDIRDELQQRRQNQIEGVTKQIAESGWLGRLASEVGAVLIAPINTLAGAAYTAGVALGADEAEMSAAKQSSHISQSMHNANVTEIKKVYSDPETGEETALSKALSGLYEIMYNRGNSLMNAITWGKLMPHLAAEGKVADFINSVISATPIALSAASDALESAIDRGADPTQQAIIFASTLIAESWTEGIEFGHIEEAGKLLLTKKGITTFLKNYIPNALSEVVGESANDLIENAADYWVKYINNPDYQTEHDNAVKKALAEDDTLTPEQAEALVHQAEVDGVLHTAIISFFSPGADVVSMAGNTLTTYYGYAKEARAYNNGLQPQVRLYNSKSIRDIRLEHEAAQQEQPVRVERPAETPQTEQTEQAQPEQYPVNGPEPNTRNFRERGAYGEAMDAYETGIMALESAMEADATTKAAAIASTINTGNPYMAQAAAAKLDIVLTQGLLYAGKQSNINIETLSTGLQLAALGDGMCAQIMNTGIETGMGIYDMAQQIAAAVGADMQNPSVIQGVTAGIHDARVNEEFKRLMATGLADAAIEAQAKVDTAREATRAAEQEAEQKNNELDAARKGVSDAAAAVAADPINDGNQMTGALAKMTSAAAVAQEYAQKLDKARKEQQKVEDENRKAIESTTAYMRQQAEKTVAQQEAEENVQAQAEVQARAEAERAEQMARNITTLQTEDFVEKYYPNATEEQKENIAQRIDYMKQQTSAEAILDRAQFVKNLSNKFGTKIRVADTTEGGNKPRSNAYVDINTGEIVVDRNSTMSDIIYAVLPHELMHLAEKSGNYKALADTLLQIKYGNGVTYDAVLQAANSGNRGDVTATAVVDVLAHKALYDSTLGATHTNEYALHETVADLMGSLFRSGENGGVNADLVNRLVSEEPNVAKRIMNAIKSFIRKMAGFNDPALTQAQAAVDMLNEALKDANKQNKQDKQAKTKEQILDDAIAQNGWTIKEGTWGNMSDDFSTHREVFDGNGKSLGNYYNDGNITGPDKFAQEILKSAGFVKNGYGNYWIPSNTRHSISESVEGEAVPIVSDGNGEPLASELPGGTVYVSSDPKYSLSTFTDDEQTRVVRALLNQKDDNGNNLFTYDQVKEYLKNARGIAAMIAADRTRLDFEADKDQVFLKKNQDYYFTLDASTLCAKRLLYQGTFNAIQKMMPNEALMPDDLIDLVNIMREMGYETPCGICYVESRRRWLDKYAQEWLDSFKGIKGEPMPTLADLTTSDGLSEMNEPGSPKYAPETRQAFIDAMNAKGSANPKVVQLRTEYNGDIRKLSDSDIQKVKDIGGLRIQSFSDFETPHLLDMIQAVYDMAAVRLTSQAYTKVPNFAWVFGDTGIKINLSLIGKGTGLDADGNLVFDNVEGMNIDDAMRLRDRYSKNVGTILVGINDEHIIAAMGDPRIDFIIPFHKSGWSHGELSRIPVLNSYKDYTATQNEQYILEANIVKEKGKGQKAVDNWIAKNGEKYPGYKVIDEGNGQFTIEYRDGYKSESFTKHKERTGEKLSNFEPVGANQYWNFDESGEWNARKYLQMCAESKRLPKFYQFLVDNGDGSFSLPEGNDKRSTAIREGYWKTLIDFKMYENDGYGRTKEDGTRTEVKGSRQTEVTPNVNMQQAERVMNEHKLGRQMPNRADGTAGPFIPMKSNNDLPTAEPAAEAFAEFLKYKRQRQEKLTRERLARNPKKESDDARNKRIAREGAEIYQAYSARNAFGASANIPLMDQTADTGSEEPVQAQQSRMAIDAETGETVDIRHSLSDIEIDMDEVEKAVADYIANMSNDELLDYLGLNLPKSWSSEEQVQEFKQEVKSRKQLNAEYDTAINNGDIAKAGELADEAAKKAGYTLKGIHRTNGRFTVFDKSKQTGERGKTLGNAFYISSPAGSEYDSDSYGKNRMEVYVRPGRMFNLHNGLSKQKAEMVYDKYFKPFVSNDFGNTYKNHVLEKLQNGFRTMDYIDEAAEKNGTTTDEIFKWLGYNSIKDGPQYAIFDPSQIKSADPVTYDDEGNVIPLGKRFKKSNDDIRYSLPADAPYLAAVERGEMDEAQRMVDEAAKEAGYDIKGYHGTARQFNVFDKSRQGSNWGGDSRMGPGFYFAHDRETASRWTDGTRVIDAYLSIKRPLDLRGETPDDIANAIREDSKRKISEYDESYPISLDQYIQNVKRIEEMNLEHPSFFIDGFKYDENGKMTDGIREFLSGLGYDGIISDKEIVVFEPEQIKSADPVTYDDNGNVIPLSERFNDQNEDIRYSLPSNEVLDQQIRHYLTAPLEGENPSATIPSEGNAQRQFGPQTAQRSDELDAFVRQFLKDNSGYIPDTNEAQINRAIQWIRSNKNSNESDGLAESIQKIAMEDFDYRSADGQARMIATMGLAVAKKDAIAQAALADAYNRQGTDLGRALQARKLFRLMTPAGRVATLQKMLQNTQAELAAKGRNIDLKFSDWVYMAASAASNEGDFRKVQKRAAEELAAQIPANWKDKARAFRMLAMLGNPRTHVRNVIGNALFIPAVSIKNKLGAVAELGLEKGERTKTLRIAVDKSIRDFAKQDAIAMKDELTGDSRWNEGNAVRREVKPFKGFMQKLVDANGNALEFEDWFFLKGHYTRALGGWMQANGYTAEQMRNNPALLEKGRAYAVQEAQKATYRDANKLAQTLNKVSREGGVAGFLVDAVLPFKKTPANILRRGIEYSPVGIMKTLTADAVHLKQYMDAKNVKLSVMPDKAISPNQFIDHLCAGLTGSAIMAVGALLASMGIASAGMDDDDDKFDELRGGQEYSFKVNLFGQDVTYTMDWAAPMSMPFFVGAAIFDQLNGERGDFNIENLINDLGAMAEPVFNLSMLDGVNTLFQTSQYDDTNTITQIGGKIASNYVTSYIPSLLGATARTIDPVRRKSFVKSGEGGGLMGTFRYAIEQTQNKIPGLSQQNIAYRNAWGEADESSTIEKIFENFLSPGYISSVKEDPVLDELERLYNSTEVDDSTRSNLIPKLPNKAISGTALEAEQYDAVTIQRGQTAKNLLTELMNTDYFKSAADQDRAKMVSDVWTFATQTANNAAVGRKMDGWVLNTQTNPVQGIINRSKKTVADETKDGWKAEAVQAVQMGDFDALDVCIERLGELGVKKSSVKTAVGNAFKEDYIKAYQRDDYATMYDIEGTLEDTGLFTYADFEKWLDDMNKSIEDEDEGFVYDTIGQYGRGNIDLNNRKVVHNPDGSISTELSFTIGVDDKVILIPSVVNGKIVSEEEAIRHYEQTGEHLGEFNTEDEAQEYAQRLHERQDWYYNR